MQGVAQAHDLGAWGQQTSCTELNALLYRTVRCQTYTFLTCPNHCSTLSLKEVVFPWFHTVVRESNVALSIRKNCSSKFGGTL